MARYTKAEAQEFYDAAKQGYLAALKMKEYEIKDRKAKRQEIEKQLAEMDRWKKYLDDLGDDGTGTPKIKVKRFVPRDIV